MVILILILITVLLNAAAQLLLKGGMAQIGYFEFAWQTAWPITLKIIANPYILGGLFSYAISVALWLLVLSRLEVSYAYALCVGLTYITTTSAAFLLFHESLSPIKLAGMGVILFGVLLLSRS